MAFLFNLFKKNKNKYKILNAPGIKNYFLAVPVCQGG
jgi:hypothetical protein